MPLFITSAGAPNSVFHDDVEYVWEKPGEALEVPDALGLSLLRLTQAAGFRLAPETPAAEATAAKAAAKAPTPEEKLPHIHDKTIHDESSLDGFVQVGDLQGSPLETAVETAASPVSPRGKGTRSAKGS